MSDSSDINQTDTKISIPPDIRMYLINVMEDAQVKGINEEVREEMIYQMFLRLDKYIAAHLIDSFSTEDDCKIFIQMNRDKKTQEEISKYLHEKIPDIKDVMAQIFIDFRELYVSKVNA